MISTGGQLVFPKKGKGKENTLNLNFFIMRTFFEIVKPGRQAKSPSQPFNLPALDKTIVSYSVPLHFLKLH